MDVHIPEGGNEVFPATVDDNCAPGISDTETTIHCGYGSSPNLDGHVGQHVSGSYIDNRNVLNEERALS
jgi:hypothetical protein